MTALTAQAAAFAAGMAATWLALPPWRAWCRRTGLVDDPGQRKIHSEPIPLAGGLAVLTGLLVPLLLGWLAPRFGLLEPGLPSGAKPLPPFQIATIALAAIGMCLLGWLDDKFELRPAVKFIGQVFVAALVAAAGVRVTLFVPSVAFSYFVTILWIVGVTNAFNFMDNMNGLCTGLGALGAGLFAVIAARHDQPHVALLAALVAGAVAGFLPHNYPRATAFLGDAGSHLIGFLLAVMAVLPHFYSPENPRGFAVLTPLFVLAVPLGDMAWVVALRWRACQPFYIGDNNHLSHRLVRRGLSRTQAVAAIWALAAAVGGLALWWN